MPRRASSTRGAARTITRTCSSWARQPASAVVAQTQPLPSARLRCARQTKSQRAEIVIPSNARDLHFAVHAAIFLEAQHDERIHRSGTVRAFFVPRPFKEQ